MLYTYRCPSCGAVIKRPTPAAGLLLCTCMYGLLRPLGWDPGATPGGTSPRPTANRIPNVIMRNVSIINCGTGVRMDGGHAEIDGLDISDTPVGIELNKGATVNARKVRFKVGP